MRFIATKVNVAPTKATSVPRLELVKAVLGLSLARTELLEIPFENYTQRVLGPCELLFSTTSGGTR